MNPLKQFRDYFIGGALAKANDVFEQAKINLLFSFTVFFFLLSTVYTVLSINATPFTFILALCGSLALVAVLIVLKTTKNVRLASFIYIANQTAQNLCHFMFANAHVEMQAVCWLLIYVIFGFLLLGRGWGFALTIFVCTMIIAGLVNEQSGYKYFHFPQLLDDNNRSPEAVLMPFLLITFLISQFVKAQSKAEKQIHEQKVLLEKNNVELEQQKRDVTSSITYAKRIQNAVLPQEETIYRSIPLSFVLYKPKDIVSGDFFWFHEIDRDNYIIVCADCTGHGVPGAMMTVVGSNLLNQTIIDNKNTKPSDIMLILDNLINITLKQQKEHEHYVQDGMDLALLRVDKAKKEFIFTSAKRPAVFIRNKQMQEFKGSKQTLGGMITGCKVFGEIKMNYEEDDIIYFYTDGYTDQFGGPKGKKFSSKQLKETLSSIHKLHMNVQKNQLNSIIENWKGNLEQVDDILVMGIRF